MPFTKFMSDKPKPQPTPWGFSFFSQYKQSSKGYQPLPLRPDLGELQWQLMKRERTAVKLRGPRPYCLGLSPQRCPAILLKTFLGRVENLSDMHEWSVWIAGLCNTLAPGVQSTAKKQPLNHKQTVIIASHFISSYPSLAPAIRGSAH